MLIGLLTILALVFILPFFLKKIEHNLEIFLFVMGVAAAYISGQFTSHLAREALQEPVSISLAVLVFGLLFKWSRKPFDRFIHWTQKKLSLEIFVFCLIFILGSLSSLITAIIASLVLVEVISCLTLDRKHEVDLVIIACFAIGIGAVLTPIGEPLSTLAIAKLKSWPDVDFWYLFRLLKWEVLGALLALSVLSIFFHGKKAEQSLEAKVRDENYFQIFLRAGKIYLFVMALVFLGQGFKPLIDRYVIPLSGDILYWINISSAVLDNATLTVAEVSPAMHPLQIKKLLMGLLLAGGMLIPGNIPNIIAASKLGIKSKEWARLGVPLGLILMVLFFFILERK